MSVVVVEQNPFLRQRMEALGKANEVRVGRAELRRELQAGEITLADALTDRRATSMPVALLVSSQRRWGPRRTRALLKRLTIAESKPTGGLTDRQRDEIVRAINAIGHDEMIDLDTLNVIADVQDTGRYGGICPNRMIPEFIPVQRLQGLKRRGLLDSKDGNWWLTAEGVQRREVLGGRQ